MNNWLDDHNTSNNLKDVRYVIAVAAGKGGVGKSTVAVNLALALKGKGYNVGVLDADIYGPSLSKMLPAETSLQNSSLHPDMLVPFESLGIKTMSLSYLRAQDDPMAVRAPIANGIILQFLHQVEWGQLDYLIVDMPPGTGDIQLTIMQKISLSGALIVTTPQAVATADVRKAIQMFHHMNVPILGLVENMSHFIEPISKITYYPLGKGGGGKISKEFGIPFVGEIPLDSQISFCADEGKSIFEESLSGPVNSCFEKISGHLSDHLYALETLEGDSLKEFELIWECKDYAYQ